MMISTILEMTSRLKNTVNGILMIQGNNVRNVSVLLTPFQQVFWGWGFNHCGIVASAFGTKRT
ncbi:hypothetical protein [Klebsiella sp. OBRC7]|uniref:hypothetical protein n=1 Tax=Klebsiella sp. OBRC7 TaxID=936565 RepID=UPI0005B53F66|nr:hypothetical protein [Klebsiella sp. OBRC7]